MHRIAYMEGYMSGLSKISQGLEFDPDIVLKVLSDASINPDDKIKALAARGIDLNNPKHAEAMSSLMKGELSSGSNKALRWGETMRSRASNRALLGGLGGGALGAAAGGLVGGDAGSAGIGGSIGSAAGLVGSSLMNTTPKAAADKLKSISSLKDMTSKLKLMRA